MNAGTTPVGAGRPGTWPVAPEWPDALQWVNCRAAPRLADWRGQVLLLVFWNAASVSSANLIAELRQLERRLPGAFGCVYVHTPRFASQQADAAVLKAAQRLQLRAPVANDSEWLAWKQFDVHAWPTTLVIDPAGAFAGRAVGEGRMQQVEDLLARLRDESPVAAATPPPEVESLAPTGPLAFPAHALATPDRLFISDSGHHRVLECDHAGHVLRQFGSGTPGYWDGRLAASGLQSPQGLALDGDALYVADAGNHCVRRIRLEAGEVETVLGAGHAGHSGVDVQGGGLHVAVNAPQAVEVSGGRLYAAAAGQNQILRVDLAQQRVEAIAGDGCSERRDGIGIQSALSQPMALAALDGELLIADAGSNAVRRLRLADLALSTVAGSSPWEPGAEDGPGATARFASPGGIAVAGAQVFLADTCNDRLCALDPASGEVRTLRLEHPLHAPLGLSFAAGALWVADRDDHAILRVDPASGACVQVTIDA